MFLSSSSVAGSTVRADVVVVGSGAAGLALVDRLSDSGADVLVVETGGLEHDPSRRGIDQGRWVGDIGVGIPSRKRFLGGSTNCWGGNCAPMDANGYEERPWVPHSGWPIAAADLRPYVAETHDLLRVPFDTFEVGDWRERLDRVDRGLLLAGSSRIETKIFQRSRVARFGELLRRDLDRSNSVRVLLDTQVIQLVRSGDRIDHLRAVPTDGGPEIRIEGAVVVLAAAIENSRLLLVSDVGNEHDQVGRYFMGHFHFVAGRLEPTPALEDVDLYTIPGDVLGYVHGAKLAVGALRLDPGLQQEREVLDAAAFLLPYRPHEHWMGRSRAAAVARGSLAAARRRPGPTFGWQDLVEGATEMPAVAAHGVGELGRRARGRRWHGVRVWGEQAPDPDNRLQLDHATMDRFGLPRVLVRSSTTELDRRTLHTMLEVLDEEFRTAGLGRVVDELPRTDRWPRGAAGTSHFMGGTRMHPDPRHGVVDADCRVHGTENLYVAGASVFPTSGLCMATYHLVLLARRLGDHLARAAGASTTVPSRTR